MDANLLMHVEMAAVVVGTALNLYGAWINRRNLAEIERLRRLANRLADCPPADPYRNAACDPRQCDHCHQVYRGPAVYCSPACAEADA